MAEGGATAAKSKFQLGLKTHGKKKETTRKKKRKERKDEKEWKRREKRQHKIKGVENRIESPISSS